MTRKAKMTDPKPVVTMEDDQRITFGRDLLGWVAWDRMGRPLIDTYQLRYAEDYRAVADFLDQLEGADLLSQVTE